MKKQRANNEHQKISKALIENDTNFLLNEYGTIDNARITLQKLEHYLNYGE